jgi:hypothetical protein
MKNILFSFCLLALLACNNFTKEHKAPYPRPRTGKYMSHKPGYIDHLNARSQGFRRLVIGCELDLHPNGTYDMLTCACISGGRWQSDSGKVYLMEQHINWRMDTFRIYGFNGEWPKVSKQPIVYTIDGNELYQCDKKGGYLTWLQYSPGHEVKDHQGQ